MSIMARPGWLGAWVSDSAVTETSVLRDIPRAEVKASASCRHVNLAIFALAIGGFAIGTTEFVTMGLLPQIADGVGITIPKAGHLVSAYALGVVVGAPLIATLAARMRRKSVLIWLMVAFAAGNIASSMAASYPKLMVARFLSGLTGRSSASAQWPHQPAARDASVRAELLSLKRLQVWLALLIGTVGFGGMFATATAVLAGPGYEWPSRVGVLLALSGVGIATVSVLVGRREGRAA